MRQVSGSGVQSPDSGDSTLWRVSAYDRACEAGAVSAPFSGLRPNGLPTTLLADLRRLRTEHASEDVLEVIATFVRHREAGLVCIEHAGVVWPLTLFPHHGLCHTPRDLLSVASHDSLATLKLLSVEKQAVPPPSHALRQAAAADDKYRPLAPLLWAIALHGPRQSLLTEIGGRAAYRLVHGRVSDLPTAPGALLPAVQRLEQKAASLRDMARWPGLSLARACRLLNALYLTGGLIVTRGHPAARGEPTRWHNPFSGLR